MQAVTATATATARTQHYTQPPSTAQLRVGASEAPAININPATLAYVNFGLFKNLCALGTSRERICAALSISNGDFDSLSQLTGN